MSASLFGSTYSGVAQGFRLTVQEVVRKELDVWDDEPAAGGQLVGFMCT
jgi:hypothetical protein